MSMQSVRLADGSNWYVDKDNKVIRVLYRQWLTPAKWRKATKSETKRVLRVFGLFPAKKFGCKAKEKRRKK